jgi:hypothetical protein
MKARDLFELRSASPAAGVARVQRRMSTNDDDYAINYGTAGAGLGAPTIEPPVTRPHPGISPARPAPSPPKRQPQFPNPFRRRERPTIIPRPKACVARGESRAHEIVDALLEVKMYATNSPPNQYRKLCPRCAQPMPNMHGGCPHCAKNRQPSQQPARSATTSNPV